MTKPPQDLAASIHRRLLNGARERGEDFQLTLVRYGAERLLFRLSQSPHADQFILKGALLLLLWEDQLYRPTRDVDLEGFGETDPSHLEMIFRSVCEQSCPEDALRFDAASVAAQEIRATHEYGGVRVTFAAYLGKARIPMQVDVGYGDAITPNPTTQNFPTLLDQPAPRMRMYPLETVVAEKFEAMTSLGRGNSRMKDFRDLLTFARRCEFDGPVLAKAARATFKQRDANLADLDEVLDADFYRDDTLTQRWRAYLRSQPSIGDSPPSFAAVGSELVPFLRPIAAALRGGPLSGKWSGVTGWG